MNKIHIVENFCTNYEHAPINAAFIKNNLLKYPKYKIIFYAEELHIKAVKGILKEYALGVDFICINTYRGKSFFYNLANNFIFFYKLIKKKEFILVTTLSIYNLIAIKVLIKYSKTNLIQIVPHAVLGILGNNQKVSFVKKIKRIIVYPISFKFWFYSFNSSKLNYIILGESIAKNLFSLNKKIAYFCKVINHPYIYTNNINSKEFNNKKIKIGFLGIGNKEKGIDKYFNLINKLNSEEYNLEFYLIGKLKYDFEKPDNLIVLSKNDNMISKETMDKVAMEMDFFIFLLKKEDYRLRASGTFFDAINYGKPIISLSNDFTDYYLCKVDNYVFKDVNEIEVFLKALKDKDNKEYLKLIDKVLNLKNYLNGN